MPNPRHQAALGLTVLAGLLSFVPLPVVAQSNPAPVNSPASAASPTGLAPVEPPENPLITKRVIDTFNAWQRGHIDRTTYSPAAGGTDNDALIAVVAPDLRAIGPLQNVRYRTASLLLGDVVYRYEITGASGVVSVLYSLDPNGKTDGVVFTPQIFRASDVPS